MAEETRIMEMNTKHMTPKSKKYFSKREIAILRDCEDADEDDEDNDEGGSRDEYFSNYYHSRGDW